ncbi:MAG: hypothetical protein K9G31_03205 [Crocinitomicaceae bacterium]|nr:hypothetical protein [Crocinitomicaceae bacterium]MCF8444770.1 hypothetical protein [Crocinitomicaceae bacterium]
MAVVNVVEHVIGGIIESGEWRVESGELRVVDYRLRIADYRLRITDCGLQIADCGFTSWLPSAERIAPRMARCGKLRIFNG